MHHGDDFAIVGTRSEVKWISEKIGQTFIVKDRGTLGPRHWDKKVMTILHRVLRWVPHSDNGPERIEYEADPRHREVLSLKQQQHSTTNNRRSSTNILESQEAGKDWLFNGRRLERKYPQQWQKKHKNNTMNNSEQQKKAAKSNTNSGKKQHTTRKASIKSITNNKKAARTTLKAAQTTFRKVFRSGRWTQEH